MSFGFWASVPRNSGGIFDVDTKHERLRQLDEKAAEPGFWDDRELSEQLMREKRRLEREVEFFAEIEEMCSDAQVLLELADEAEDADTTSDTVAEAHEKVGQIRERLGNAELRRMLSGEHDAMTAIVSVNAGAGGTEAQDWAEILLRMYSRWCERRGYEIEILDLQEGEEAGIKSVTFTIAGDHAYGYLRSEVGIHRLVRISPFDAQKRRHTSFASFTMVPDVGDDVEIEIEDKDLRIDTYRAGGAGGQHVNRTDSAVRLTHIPTGIVVQCQNERSQHKNKASAMKVLNARLYERARAEKREEVDRLAGEKKEIGFGSQIRSYTLHPTQRVKDHRTKVEAGNAQAVLDGQLDDFIRAYLLEGAGA